jgi:hypothetical protein
MARTAIQSVVVCIALAGFACVKPQPGMLPTGDDAAEPGGDGSSSEAGGSVSGDAPVTGEAGNLADASSAASDSALVDLDGPLDLAVAPFDGAGGTASNGTACTSGASCASHLCADGVCCESACAGQCEACAEAGSPGKCVAISGAPRGSRSACTGQGSACGATCNGSNRVSCAYPAAEKECAAASCTGGTAYARSLCNGAGACSPQTTVQCGAAACAGTVCGGGCSAQAPCPAAQYCSGGRCFPQLTSGASCTSPESCQSGNCVDGVCCATACKGACEACNNARTGAASGTCAPIPSGQNPDHECADEGASSCGQDGTCDGARACHRYPMGTACAAAGCGGGSFMPARACNGQGVCTAAGAVACGAYACFATGCRTSCLVNGDCAAPNSCINGTCGSKKGQGSGCNAASECASGSCMDGVCCENGCSGLCSACRQSKTGQADGKCAPVSAGSDPDNECADQGAATCGTDGTCNGAGACRKYVVGTACGSTTCNGSTLMSGGSCDGNGTCGAGGSTPCSPYACTAGGCKTSCTGAAQGQHPDCAAGYGCEDGGTKCKPLNGTWHSMGYNGGGEIIRPAGPDPSGACVIGSSWYFKVASTPGGLECQVRPDPAFDYTCSGGAVAYKMIDTDTIRDCGTSMTYVPSAYRRLPGPGPIGNIWCLPSGSTTAGCAAYPFKTGCDTSQVVGRLFRCY